MKKDNYEFKDTIARRDLVLGQHSPKWTEESIFERYYNLMEKNKIYKYEWTKRLPKYLFNKCQKEPTSLNLFALAGALASIYNPQVIDKEKDNRIIRPELSILKDFLSHE
jgi:hypothetical protein